MFTVYRKETVSRGAVLSRIHSSFITRSPITRSIAVLTLLQVTREIRDSPIFDRLLFFDNRNYIYAALWLAK
jgi:hypothetical protein